MEGNIKIIISGFIMVFGIFVLISGHQERKLQAKRLGDISDSKTKKNIELQEIFHKISGLCWIAIGGILLIENNLGTYLLIVFTITLFFTRMVELYFKYLISGKKKNNFGNSKDKF